MQQHDTVRRFYVFSGDPLTPLDFYFDSDVTAAVIRYVCERLGRPSSTLVVSSPPAHMPAPVAPEANQIQSGMQSDRAFGGARIGLVPATLRGVQQLYSAFDELHFDALLFASETWGTPLPNSADSAVSKSVVTFSSQDASRDDDIGPKLHELRKRISKKISSSSLPACIRDNRYLDFQFDHIVTKRWLGYARLIRQASALVKERPLELLIRSDHFTAEGAVLSHLYRRAGTPVMVALHSSWPVDINWRSPRHSDFALAWSKSSARRIAQCDPRTRVCTVGDAVQDTFRRIYPYEEENAPLRTITESVRRKKVVLLLTNAIEIHAVPITDPVAYFETCAALASIPAGLRDRVALLVRTKPGPFGEDPILYEAFSGLAGASSTGLASLGFDDCLRLADCVVGVNVPTSAYWDVLRGQVPLVHLQTSDAVALHPDLPADVVGCITDGARIWDEIAPVLFDETHRRQLIERQRAFFESEHRPEHELAEAPLLDALRLACRPALMSRLATASKRWGAALRRAFSSGAEPVETTDRANGNSPARAPFEAVGPKLDDLVLTRAVTAGHVDEVSMSFDGRTIIVRGWAAALTPGQPAKRIHVFVNEVHRGGGETAIERPDVAAATGNPDILTSGFWLKVEAGPKFDLSGLAIYGQLADGTCFEVPLPRRREGSVSGSPGHAMSTPC
ncbi:hypothetical protein [Paraburkholderia flagellata]|uniref:hypothetical protein n=1 Tax=Paraburkholderia flagellata TaxID=2883241 RepID=UPI001F16B433|nr:hypothetical protein [Paraburkholderia flagellata]